MSVPRYYVNLCREVFQGPPGCSPRASVCRKNPVGQVEVLGLIHTQKLDVIGEAGSGTLGWWGCVCGVSDSHVRWEMGLCP